MRRIHPLSALFLALGVTAAAFGSGCTDSDGDGYSALEDCDDQDGERNFGAAERCNGIDDDCDGLLPEDEADLDGDGHLACIDDCDDGDAHTHGGTPDAEDEELRPALELCDEVDNDCDGTVDEGFEDANEDGVLDCLEEDLDGDGVLPWQGDCDDGDPDAYEGAPELCDGLDNDCNGFADADAAGEVDRDADGSLSCEDCDDDDVLNFPGNPEVCDGLDNDCDGTPDNGVLPTWYLDEDGDGFGRDDVSVQSCVAVSGYSEASGDCADDDPFRSPGLTEVCDGIDNDCDTFVDDDVLTTFWSDVDGDGFGDIAEPTWACTAPPGYAAVARDCDPADPAVHPGADEICDRKDSNCDGSIPAVEIDGDGDDVTLCEQDCDDTDPLIYWEAPEACSGIDEDCDGTADNGNWFDMCPAPADVALTECLPGPTCGIVDCSGGFFDIDTTYGNGCECADDTAGSDCSTAFSVGSLANGNVFYRVGRLPEPQLVDWVHAHFPDNGRGGGNGFPTVKFSSIGNPGNNYRFDVFVDCNGTGSACTTGGPTNLTSWDFQDNVSAGQQGNHQTGWPGNIYLRVFRIGGGNNCDQYELEFSR